MKGTAIALGTFDGLHTGHIAVLKKALESKYQPIVVTFQKPPKMFLGKKAELLLSPIVKKELLENMGFSRVHFIDFEQFIDMQPVAFLEYLKREFNCKFISCGFNYRFGKNGVGDTKLLSTFCQQNSIEFYVTDAVIYEGQPVSSTGIRQALEDGNVENYKLLCDRYFSFSGEVIHGEQRGRTIGFPTVNQLYPENMAAVKRGVYKTLITIDGITYNSLTNIGVRPTFLTDKILCETFILNFDSEIYGKIATVQLLKFIRGEKKFESLGQLKNAIQNDLSQY